MSEERKAINGEEATAPRRARLPRAPRPRLPQAADRAAFALQERIVWPLEDRAERVAPGRGRGILGGAAGLLATAALGAGVVLAAGGGSSSTGTDTEAQAAPPAAAPPLVATPSRPQPPPAKPKPKAPTLHGAVPVFEPAPRKGAEKKARTSQSDEDAAKVDSSQAVASPSEGASAADSAAGTTELSSPASARISSNPENSKPAPSATAARAAAAPTVVPDGPPAGPKALAVARRFAGGFVAYETGGEEGEFKRAFAASATSQLTEALLKRPPRQPAGVKVPRAKVVNVVAGPSQGTVYKVSVSLLRVGVTSELRLAMEKSKRDGWRVTNVLG